MRINSLPVVQCYPIRWPQWSQDQFLSFRKVLLASFVLSLDSGISFLFLCRSLEELSIPISWELQLSVSLLLAMSIECIHCSIRLFEYLFSAHYIHEWEQKLVSTFPALRRQEKEYFEENRNSHHISLLFKVQVAIYHLRTFNKFALVTQVRLFSWWSRELNLVTGNHHTACTSI